jgi:hypothetical protein
MFKNKAKREEIEDELADLSPNPFRGGVLFFVVVSCREPSRRHIARGHKPTPAMNPQGEWHDLEVPSATSSWRW